MTLRTRVNGRSPAISFNSLKVAIDKYTVCSIILRKMIHEKDIADDGRWKAKSRQTKAEMARPGERRYGQKPDDN